MELNEMLVSLRREVWEDDIRSEMNDFFSPDWWPFHENVADFVPHSSFEALSPSFERRFTSFPLDQACYCPSANDLSGMENTDSSCNGFQTSPFTFPISYLHEEELCGMENTDSSCNGFQTSPFTFPISYLHEEELCVLPFEASCEMEQVRTTEVDIRTKKLQRKPSKNLMAERRRRKRLNERLSMLRSIVPKISKMDRTAILGDTIDYMKELLEKISYLKREIEVGANQIESVGPCRDVKLDESSVKSSQKLEVEERNGETWIEIRCPGKPRLLSLTVNALEALGLEIKECVISSFNDFAMQASCSKESKQGTMAEPEDIKKALFRTAGYEGRRT